MYEDKVFRTYWDYGIYEFPVDCEKILKRLEFKVLSYREISRDDKAFYIKMMQVSSDAFVIREEKRLYINNEVMPKRRLFTLAHEIGHIVMDTDDEDVANDFASNLLAPRPIIYAKGLRTAEEISKFFGISISAANNAVIKDSYRPDPDGIRIIEFFSRYGICRPYADLVPHVQQSKNKNAIPVFKFQPIDEECVKKNKNRIRSLDRKRTRIYNKMLSIDALSYGAQEKYNELQREIWNIEKEIEVLENRIPEITRVIV